MRLGDLGLVTRLVRVTDNEATGRLFRQCRTELGISIRRLAKRIGWSAAYLSYLELGRRNWTEGAADKIRAAMATMERSAE